MRIGLYVLCVFAAAWGCVALYALGAPPWSRIAPPLVSLAIAGFAAPRVLASRDRGPDEARRIRRLVMLWSALEVAAMLLAVNILPILGLERQVVPAASLCVALHFFPLGWGLPYRPYVMTGSAMTATSVAAMALPGVWPTAASAAGGAVVLWASALWMVRYTTSSTPN